MSKASSSIDLVIIGAGIVGLSTARALLLQFPHLQLTVLEKESEVAQHQTGRNSGVIHSGLYYKPGSLKAMLCTKGAAAMIRYCQVHNIPYRRCGKVVVATEESELPRLQDLYERGVANGVPEIALIGPEQLREIEPHAVGVRALHSPNTSITDYRQVVDSFVRDIESMGGVIKTGQEVTAIEQTDHQVRIKTKVDAFATRHLITCGGVYADRLAAASGGALDPRIIPFRGDYYILKESQRHLINALIYPVPDPNFPFLGVHSTLKMDGSMWLGPNAVLAFGRESYRRSDFNASDLWETLSARGFRKLAFKFWRTGLDEMIRDFSQKLFVKSIQKYVPDITTDGVDLGPSGIRAQALTAEGELVDDFVFDQVGAIIHVRNAPSPAATASLPIGEYIAKMAADTFDFHRPVAVAQS
jgi:L-2-hydroxyglutarate oxidase LhgO